MPGATTAKKAETGAETDEQLLERIARDRDRDAFKLLFDRYQTKGYSLAMYIIGNAHAAEEAFQEAMIKVWLRASTYNGSGSIEGWIMRIVARQSTRSFRGASSKKSQRLESEDQVCDKPQPAVRVAETELILLLRKALVALSGPERELIALRFAAGMSQQEISKELDVPQQTISYRIDSILKRLRSLLPNADLAATLPIAELLREAVLSGSSAPAATCASVMNRVSTSRRSLRSRTRPKSSSAMIGTAAAAAAVALCAAFVFIPKTSTATPVTPTPAPPPAAVLPVVTAAAAAKPVLPQPEKLVPEPAKIAPQPEDPDFSFKWTFEKEIPKDITVVKVHENTFKVDPAKKLLVTTEPIALVFPFLVTKKPVLIIIRTRMQPVGTKTSMGLNATVYDPNVNAERRMMGFKENHVGEMNADTGALVEHYCYLYDDMLCEFYHDKAYRVIKLDEAFRGNTIFLYLEKALLESIDARTITRSELPPECADYKRLIGTLREAAEPVMLRGSK